MTRLLILFQQGRGFLVMLILEVLLFGACKNVQSTEMPVKISLWYGEEQHFGKLGQPQAQINILGNIQSDTTGMEAYYTLNKSEHKLSLTLGSDLHRLAAPGDFNIEIYTDSLKKGVNTIQLYVSHGQRIVGQQEIKVNYTPNTVWSLPYSIDWSNTQNIQGVAQVVDGHWKITPKGIRTQDVYYDRALAIGDMSWRNYEVTTTVTFHGYTPPKKGPPTYNVSHVALATLWPGHDKDSLQPNRKWHPLGATAEFRITDGYQDCRWRIFDGDNFYAEQKKEAYRTLVEGKTYGMKHRVEDLTDYTVRYSVKLWEADREEPEEWDFQAIENGTNAHPGGSCLLIAHHTDVTFGNVDIRPVAGLAAPGD